MSLGDTPSSDLDGLKRWRKDTNSRSRALFFLLYFEEARVVSTSCQRDSRGSVSMTGLLSLLWCLLLLRVPQISDKNGIEGHLGQNKSDIPFVGQVSKLCSAAGAAESK